MIKVFNSVDEAKEAVVKDHIRLLIIDGKKIALVHTENGLVAFDNACPHQHEPLHKGSLTPYGDIVCPLHHYRFNLKTGQEANNRCRSMSVYALKITDEGVYIDL